MIMQPVLAAILGGWEMILILGALLFLAVGAAIVAGIVYLIVRATRSKTTPPPPVMPPPIPPNRP
jgi:hypothetical protein